MRVHTGMCTRAPTCTHTHGHVHMRAHMHTHGHVHTRAHMHTHTGMCTHRRLHTHARTHGHVHTCAHMHTHTGMCTHWQLHTHAHAEGWEGSDCPSIAWIVKRYLRPGPSYTEASGRTRPVPRGQDSEPLRARSQASSFLLRLIPHVYLVF